MPAEKGREIYFEITAQGGVSKVTAIDPQTGTEVSVMGPANPAAREALKTAALRKLEYMLGKKKAP